MSLEAVSIMERVLLQINVHVKMVGMVMIVQFLNVTSRVFIMEIAHTLTYAHVRKDGPDTIALFQYAFKIAITGEYALPLTLADATNGKIPGEIDVQMAEFLYFKWIGYD